MLSQMLSDSLLVARLVETSLDWSQKDGDFTNLSTVHLRTSRRFLLRFIGVACLSRDVRAGLRNSRPSKTRKLSIMECKSVIAGRFLVVSRGHDARFKFGFTTL